MYERTMKVNTTGKRRKVRENEVCSASVRDIKMKESFITNVFKGVSFLSLLPAQVLLVLVIPLK